MSYHPILQASSAYKRFIIAGDHTETFTSGTKLKVEDSGDNDGPYTVFTSSYFASLLKTYIVVNESIDHNSTDEGKLRVRRPRGGFVSWLGGFTTG